VAAYPIGEDQVTGARCIAGFWSGI